MLTKKLDDVARTLSGGVSSGISRRKLADQKAGRWNNVGRGRKKGRSHGFSTRHRPNSAPPCARPIGRGRARPKALLSDSVGLVFFGFFVLLFCVFFVGCWSLLSVA